MKLWLLIFFSSGCLFNNGTHTVARGAVDSATLCTSPSPSDDGCPPCSFRDGTRCRDQWYPTALRCTADAQCDAPGTCQAGYCVLTDADGDGLDDDFERELAWLNFPTLYLAEGEPCGAPHGVIYRARRHPQNPSRIAITYVVLYGVDCGPWNGHPGDAESFAVTVDLDAEPGAPATVGVEAWAHAGTACGSTSSCDAQAGTSGCAQQPDGGASNGVVVYSSLDKHANYLSRSVCGGNCYDACNAGERLTGPLLNVGEPDHPLVTDLTAQGFVQAADGWGPKLLHVNPWSTVEFGGGGRLDVPLANKLAPAGQ